MAAKRRLDFTTPSRKRRKAAPMVLYRNVGTKPEMKTLVTTTTYVADTTDVRSICTMAAGSASGQRVGNRIKVWCVEGLVACSASTPIRLDIMTYDTSGSITYTYDGALDRRKLFPVFSKFLINGTTQAAAGYQFFHRLPYGIVVRYPDDSSTGGCHNDIVACLATPGAETITGYFRIWYTDV